MVSDREERMGRSIKKSELITLLQHLRSFSSPKIKLEQYSTDAISTADLLYYIAFEKGDFRDAIIVDLGAGTGHLSIGSLLLGAEYVIAVEKDKDAIDDFKRNLEAFTFREEIENRLMILEYDVTSSDFSQEMESVINKVKRELKRDSLKITTISNPPFGVHNRGVDLRFLIAALPFSDIIYSIHLASQKSLAYLSRKLMRYGARIIESSMLKLRLTHSYSFHRKRRKEIECMILRILPKN